LPRALRATSPRLPARSLRADAHRHRTCVVWRGSHGRRR
jgi:hypothetical protein